MALKQDCVHFVLCPKQANKIEGVVLNRVCILGSYVLNRVRVKTSVAHLYPNIGRVPTDGFVVVVINYGDRPRYYLNFSSFKFGSRQNVNVKCKERSIDCTSALMFVLSILKLSRNAIELQTVS